MNSDKRGDVTKWLEATGLEILDMYKNQSVHHTWRCKKAQHTFVASFSSLKQRKVACTQCMLDDMQDQKRIILMTINAHTKAPTASLRWKCSDCGEEFDRTLAAMCRRKHPCDCRK